MIPDGTILKNSAKPMNGFKYNHPFDGHGFINAFTLRNGDISYNGIRVKTEHYALEKKYNKQLFRGLNTNVKNNRLFIENFSNISVFYDTSKNEVQSLSEGGMPYLIDIENHETIGRKFDWIPPFIPYFPITAHPKMDNGRVVNASSLIGMMTLFDDYGIIFSEIFADNQGYYFHDFAITDTHYIFYLNNVSVNILPMYFSDDGTILDGFGFNNNNKILLVNKETKERQYVDIPNEIDRPALHIAYVKQDGDEIDMYMAFIPSSFSISDIQTAHDFEGCYLHKIKIINGKVKNTIQISDIHCEMPVQSGENIFLINENTLVRCDTRNDTIKTIHFENEILEEPVLHDNVLFVISHGDNVTNIHAYNADTLIHIHTKRFPFNVSYGFHGTFVPS